jgi:hypothetical protein
VALVIGTVTRPPVPKLPSSLPLASSLSTRIVPSAAVPANSIAPSGSRTLGGGRKM